MEAQQEHVKILFFKMSYIFIKSDRDLVCNCSMFCCTLLYVRSSIAIILMGKRELVAFA